MSQENFKIENVTAIAKANIYFDGKVVSHTILEKNGQKKTLGIIYPGNYTFNTGAPEIMTIIAGSCEVRLAGDMKTSHYEAGSEFKVPANSEFTIAVTAGITEYICTFEVN